MPISQPTARQFVILAVIGVFYWFLAAQIVRLTADDLVGNTGATMLAFALVIVGTVPALLIGFRLAGLSRAHAVIGAVVMTGAATLCDGMALTWFRWLYGTDAATVLGGAALILWGAGVALVLSMAMQRGS